MVMRRCVLEAIFNPQLVTSWQIFGTFQRLFMISYLDEEILIIRDSSGAPEVLTRLEGPPSVDSEPVIAEYES
ncbi:hypothetical protein HPP92_002972 [Vanilla planifolia]|uniref:Uncharacterized protein n=1 Tax=Vanilla planifolia TaxID=51239 RepID=A0A835VIZ6_VANPL|nr:hypothetical protein HPP92_002972 [Vanilla planifolia]